MAAVAVVRGEDRKHNLERALELNRKEIEDAIAKKGSKKLFIKVNAIDPNFPGACTHPEALEVVLDRFHERFEEVIVGDNTQAFSRGAERNCYGELAARFENVHISNLSTEGHERISFRRINGGETGAWVSTLPRSAFTISLALPKTHDHVVFTACLKNMLGCVIHKRPWVHGLEFYERVFLDRYLRSVGVVNENLAEVIMRAGPDLCLLDGFSGMEGDGPIMGEVVEMGVAMCSLDGVALDMLAAEMCGFEDVPYLQLCRTRGPSVEEETEIIKDGFEEIEELKRRFRPHYLYPYQCGKKSCTVPWIDFRLLWTYMKRFYRVKDKIQEKIEERQRERQI